MVYSNKHIDLNVVDALYKKGYEYHMNEEWIEAAKYYQEAASFGHTEAMEALGEFYINGLGVKLNHEKGLMLLERAAEQGSSDACYALGEYYFIGYDAESNAPLAKSWWKKATDRGHVRATKTYNYYFGRI